MGSSALYLSAEPSNVTEELCQTFPTIDAQDKREVQNQISRRRHPM